MAEKSIKLKLNSQQQKLYYEYYAREVLVSLLPAEFDNLQKSDKPDLQDMRKSIGIEVTLVLPDNEPYAIDLYDKFNFATVEEKEKLKKHIEGIGVDLIDDGKIRGFSYDLSPVANKHLIEAAKKKIDRLNNTGDDEIYEYRDFDHYRLFINATNICKENNLYELIDSVIDLQQNHVRKYETIYVYSIGFGLLVCDLATKQVCEYPATDNQKARFKQRALEFTK